MKKYKHLLFSSLCFAMFFPASSQTTLADSEHQAEPEFTHLTNVSLERNQATIHYQRNKEQTNSHILHAVWSDENGQDDLKWYTAGEESTAVDLRNHQGYGTYHVHTYIHIDGKMIGLNTTHFTLEKAETSVTTQISGDQAHVLFQRNREQIDSHIIHAVWSEENGQDDIQWYTAHKTGAGTYTYTINTQKHNSSGLFHTHVYRRVNGQMIGVTTANFQVDKPAQAILYKPDYAGAATYPVGQCTWGAKVLAPWAGPYWGNGGQWGASARQAGFKTGTTAQVGAIISWDDGGYGHVGVVTHVESDTRIQIKEANYAGSPYINNYRGWFNPLTTGEGRVTYIYPKN